MNNDPTKSRDEADTLFGRDITVQFEDPAKQPETVTVRKVSRRLMERYALLAGHDELTEVSFYTGKPAEWVEGLTEEAFDTLVTVGRDLNVKRLANFATRATKFENQIRQAAPVLGPLADQARNAVIASHLAAASNS